MIIEILILLSVVGAIIYAIKLISKGRYELR